MKTPDITCYLKEIASEKAKITVSESRITKLQECISEMNTLSKEELIAKSIELKAKLDEASADRAKAYVIAEELSAKEVEIEDEYDKVMYQISLFK